MKVFAAVLLVPATFFWQLAARPQGPDPVAEGGVRFSHRFHVEDVGALCEDCHEAAAESATGEDNLLPGHDQCSVCHDEVDEPDECGTCHTNADDPEGLVYITDYSKKFPHETHLANGLECRTCHEEVATADYGDELELPGMVRCVDCHEERAAPVECMTCHEEGEDLLPSTHVVGFTRMHGQLAEQSAISANGELKCQTCHDDSFCQDCHEGENLDRLTHPVNYAFTHALDVQSGAVNCSTCHTERQFCSDCHADYQLMPQTHTVGWAIPNVGGRHAIEAEADIETCISCHEADAAVTCTASGCHEDGGVGDDF